MDELTSEDTRIIWMPDVPYDQQKIVGEKIVRLYEMRDEANALEAEAIADMEAVVRLRS